MEACDVLSFNPLNNMPGYIITNRVLGVSSIIFMFVSCIVLQVSTLSYARLSVRKFLVLLRISSSFMLLGFVLISIATVIYAVEVKKTWQTQDMISAMNCTLCNLMQFDFGWALYLLWSEAAIMIPSGKGSKLFFFVILKFNLMNLRSTCYSIFTEDFSSQ